MLVIYVIAKNSSIIWYQNYNMKVNDPYQFGYYQCLNKKFFSKIEAMEYADRYNSSISFHYNDHVFSQQDWHHEPTQTLTELYLQRATQLRSQYDYIVLFYSGGADSHNMLESFVHAGVHIDEIASFHSYAADHDKQSSFNREVFETAVPYVENLKKQKRLSETTQHRLIDQSQLIADFTKQMHWQDFPYLANSTISINNMSRADLRTYVTDWQDIINQGKRLCLIWAHDKPRIHHLNGQFHLFFMDIFDNCVSTKLQHLAHPGYFDEMFYSTPDFPQLVIKQAHVISKFLQTCDINHPYVTKDVTGLGHVMKDSQAYWLTQDAQSLIIYPWFDPGLYYEPKPRDILYSQRDRWFWSDQDLSNRYRDCINALVNRWGDRWLNQNPNLRATRNYRTQNYCLGF